MAASDQRSSRGGGRSPPGRGQKPQALRAQSTGLAGRHVSLHISDHLGARAHGRPVGHLADLRV